MPSYSKALSTDSAGKKFSGVVANNAGTDEFDAIRGLNRQTLNTETVADQAVAQDAHDNLNANANLQIANADVSNANPVPVSDAGGALTVDGTVTAVAGGDIAHDSVDSGNPVSIGGRASASAPSAVAGLDRVRAWFDLNGRLVVDVNAGPTAHDAADAGNPTKIGGKASSALPAAVAAADRVDMYFDLRGRPVVVPGFQRVSISPADPTAGGTSDITQVDGTAVEAGDLTIRDTDQHRFYVPMAKAGYRTALIYLENDAVAWDQAPLIQLFGCVNISGSYVGAQLLSITGVVTASNRIAIGVGGAGLGANVGTSPVPGTNYWYQCDAIAAGWEYLELRMAFGVAPAQGEYDDIVIIRQA